MIGFPLTKKRLLSQPERRKHRLIADWFKELYLENQSSEMNPNELEFVYSQYKTVLEWLGANEILKPASDIDWKEFFADQYHVHYALSGKGLAEHSLLPEVITGDRHEDLPWKETIQWKVALNNIRSAFNVGSVLRTSDGAGWEEVIMGGSTPDGTHSQVQKTSMNTSNWIPWRHSESLDSDLLNLKSRGYRIIGLETVEGAVDYREYPWPEKGVLVLGNEEYGISKSVLGACDDFVQIPMQGRKNSINVANAFAVIAFFHLSRLFVPEAKRP